MMMESMKIPKVAVNAFVVHKGQVLLCLRHSAPPAWTVPGGHMHSGETLEDATRREVKEETGVEVDDLRVIAVCNDVNTTDNTHYVNFFLLCQYCAGTVVNGEPEDLDRIEWYPIQNLPRPLFINIRRLLAKISLNELIALREPLVCDL